MTSEAAHAPLSEPEVAPSNAGETAVARKLGLTLAGGTLVLNGSLARALEVYDPQIADLSTALGALLLLALLLQGRRCWTSLHLRALSLCLRHLRMLPRLLRRIHGGVKHVGKVYLPPDPTVSQIEKRLEGLRRKLERAVQAEDFERAAELRDEIRAMGPAQEVT